MLLWIAAAATCPSPGYMAGKEHVTVTTGRGDEIFAVRDRWYFDRGFAFREPQEWKVAHGSVGAPTADGALPIRFAHGFVVNGTMTIASCDILWDNGAVWTSTTSEDVDFEYLREYYEEDYEQYYDESYKEFYEEYYEESTPRDLEVWFAYLERYY